MQSAVRKEEVKDDLGSADSLDDCFWIGLEDRFWKGLVVVVGSLSDSLPQMF